MTLYITSISQNIPCNLARLRFFYSIVIACCFSIAPSRTIGGTLRCANSPTPPANISPLFPSSLPTFNRIFRTYENDAKIVFFLLKNFFFGPFFLCDPTIFDPFSMTHYCLLIFLCVLLFVLCPSFFFYFVFVLVFRLFVFLNFLSVVLFSSNFHQFSFQTVLLFWITNWYCLLFWQLNTFLVPFLYLTPPQTSTDLGLDSALASVIYLLSHVSSLFGIIFILLFERALIQKRMLYFNFFLFFFASSRIY